MLMITWKKKKKADEYSVTPVKTCPQILSFFGHKRVKMFLYVPPLIFSRPWNQNFRTHCKLIHFTNPENLSHKYVLLFILQSKTCWNYSAFIQQMLPNLNTCSTRVTPAGLKEKHPREFVASKQLSLDNGKCAGESQ